MGESASNDTGALILYLLPVLLGVMLFIMLRIKMGRDKIEDIPDLSLFVIFFNYGGLLLVALTSLLWQWSGMASIGCFYLISLAPLMMGFIGFRQYRNRHISKYHRLTYYMAVGYFIIVPFTIFALVQLSRKD